jgi:hypothetical protein
MARRINLRRYEVDGAAKARIRRQQKHKKWFECLLSVYTRVNKHLFMDIHLIFKPSEHVISVNSYVMTRSSPVISLAVNYCNFSLPPGITELVITPSPNRTLIE